MTMMSLLFLILIVAAITFVHSENPVETNEMNLNETDERGQKTIDTSPDKTIGYKRENRTLRKVYRSSYLLWLADAINEVFRVPQDVREIPQKPHMQSGEILEKLIKASKYTEPGPQEFPESKAFFFKDKL